MEKRLEKREKEKKPVLAKPVQLEPKPEADKKDKKPPVSKPLKLKDGRAMIGPNVLRAPQVTEKATSLQDKGQYVFKVAAISTKPEIKKAIEEVYGVNVLKVRTIKVPRRRRRLGGTTGWKKGYKKAIITLKKGQAIEILPR